MIHELEKLIQERQASPKEGSYTSYLFDQGVDKIAKKFGEESF
ncbi:phosphoribosyl-ATP diphosphatase, partial [Exiguobacterium mexicanum]